MGLRTKDGPRTTDGLSTRNQGPRTTFAFAALLLVAAFATTAAQRGAAPVPAPLSPLLRDYQPVTAERLKNPEDQKRMLATAGGLVFSGGTSHRKSHAFDAATGKLLWEFPMNSGALGPPSSFSVDGTQYIAVETGWGGDSRGMQATLNNMFPGEYPEVPEGGAVWVFAVD